MCLIAENESGSFIAVKTVNRTLMVYKPPAAQKASDNFSHLCLNSFCVTFLYHPSTAVIRKYSWSLPN